MHDPAVVYHNLILLWEKNPHRWFLEEESYVLSWLDIRRHLFTISVEFGQAERHNFKIRAF